MNQILSTTNKATKPPKNIDIKKIIIFFSVAIIIFVLVLLGNKLYQLYLENKPQEEIKPDIKIEQVEDKVRISVTDTIGINKIIYYWSDSDKKEIQVNGNTSMEKLIPLINGENTLMVKVIDQNGKETEATNKFTYNLDKTNPVIECTVSDTAKIKILVTDETQLDYITYQWEDEEENKIEATSEDPTKIEITLDAQRGTKKILITAVDKAGNTETIDQPFEGVNLPVIDAYQNADRVYMIITHDMGFEKVEFIINRSSIYL